MIIKQSEKQTKIEWKLEAKDKQRRGKGKYGVKRCFHAAKVRLPATLVPLVSNDKTYTYLYEYFDKVCLLPEPPENEDYVKCRLISAKKIQTAELEIPSKIFETSTMDYAIFTYCPNKNDYATNRPGLLTLDVGGENKRKWLKRTIGYETRQITYTEHVQTYNTPEGIHLHKDLTRILNPEKLYIYYYEGEFYLTDIDPNVECIETSEEYFKDDLFDYGIVKNSHELINLVLFIDELDPSNMLKPKIKIQAIEPQ